MGNLVSGSASTDAFDDVDSLTAFVNDQRGADTLKLSTVADALAVIDTFRRGPPALPRTIPVVPGGTVSVATTPKGAWASLDRGTVADGLEEIIRDPRQIRQGMMNLCGPAAFFNIVIGRHPVAVAKAATMLFEMGAAPLGSLQLRPNANLLSADYASMRKKMEAFPATQAVWMLLGALRNTMNVWWHADWRGDPDQTIAAMTRPEEVASWFRATGFFASVVDNGRWASRPGIPSASTLTCAPGTDNALLINANLLAPLQLTSVDDTFIMNAFPNHWITLLSEIVPDATRQVANLSFWTWGESELAKQIPTKDFVDNYFGAITTTIPAQGG
jgi:hypothetical protein